MFESVSDGGGGGEVCSTLSRLESVELARLFLNAKSQETAVIDEEKQKASSVDVVCESSRDGDGGNHSPPSAILTQELDAIAVQLRERDEKLELAARVGQELLERNAMLTSDLHATASSRDELEREMSHMRHQLAVKEHMMQLYAQEMEEAERSRSDSPPRSVVSTSSSTLSEEAAALLAEECTELREANRLLAEEVTLLRDQAAVLDRREYELITDCVRRLNDASKQIAELQQGTAERDELSAQHAHEIAGLRLSNTKSELAHRQLEQEKAHLEEALSETNTRHSQLASLVGELQDQYKECVDLFRQAQEELAFYRRHATVQYHIPGFQTPEEGDHSPLLPRRPISVGAELEAASKQHGFSPLSTGSTEDSTGRLPIPFNLHTSGLKSAGEQDMGPGASPPRPRVINRTSSHTLLGSPSGSLPSHASRSNEVTHAMEAVRMFSNQPGSRASTPVSSPTTSPHSSHRLPFSVSAKSSGGLNSLLSGSNSIEHPLPVKQAQSAPQKPRKVRIFKPMEGSLTLLRWKLLALEQQSGAQTLQQALSKPGVYVKSGSEQAEDGEHVKKVRSKESVMEKELPRDHEVSSSKSELMKPASGELDRTPSPEPVVVDEAKVTPGRPAFVSPLLSSHRIITRGAHLGGMPFGLGGSPGLAAFSKPAAKQTSQSSR